MLGALESETDRFVTAQAAYGAWRRLARNWSVRIGGAVLALSRWRPCVRHGSGSSIRC